MFKKTSLYLIFSFFVAKLLISFRALVFKLLPYWDDHQSLFGRLEINGCKMKKILFLSCVLACSFALRLHGQSPAALDKLAARYSPAQIEDLRTHTHYKYVGLLMYYDASWMVSDAGQLRLPTAAEIRAIDLDTWLPHRSVSERVTIPAALNGLDIVLLSRDEFETAYLASLSPSDRQQYEAYKALQQHLNLKSNP
jgi:hypothetical protein